MKEQKLFFSISKLKKIIKVRFNFKNMPTTKKPLADEMKELLSAPANQIKLDDFVSQYIKKFLTDTDLQLFPVQNINFQKEEFFTRLQKYEESTKDLQQIVILLARWGSSQEHLLLLEKIFVRLAEADKGSSGLTIWINLGWYPIQLLMYSAGIAALSARKYDVLKIVLATPVLAPRPIEKKYLPLIAITAPALANTHDAFKLMPGQETKYVPRSEHIFQLLQPLFDSLLFLGKSYEEIFDDFEVCSALVYSDIAERDWFPVGRFGWKYRHGAINNHFDRMIEEANREKEKWTPLRAGLFRGSLENFLSVSEAIKKRLNEISWF